MATMVLELLMWSLLIAIAISDLKENRIPNKAILLLVVLFLVQALFDVVSWKEGLLGGLAMFSASLGLHLIRVMAPGDVKLLGAVGLFIGWGHLTDVILYIIVAGGLIGSFFLALDIANRPDRYHLSRISFSNLILLSSNQTRQVLRYQPLRMPFAPSVVTGLALAGYYT